MATIQSVHAREVLDSRGNPTVEVDVYTDAGSMGSAIVPSGASTGTHEAVELRDGGPRYLGKGVENAVKNVANIIAPKIQGMDIADQAGIDSTLLELDGTPNKGKLGANAVLGTSMAVARAAAETAGLPLFAHLDGGGTTLPVPLMNILNGGEHADNNVSIQEFMIAPVGTDSFREALRMGVEIYHHLKVALKEDGLNTAVGDEGGFAPNLPSNAAALEYIQSAIGKAGYSAGDDVLLALDVAASEFHSDGSYDFGVDGVKNMEETVSFYGELTDRFPIISIEDGMDEDDHAGWKAITKQLGNSCQLVGDDVFVTNMERVKKGIADGEANSLLVKLNQIGTVTETLDVMAFCEQNGFNNVVSHRSGETEDNTISHVAVATDAGQIKTGAPARSDRVAKYNELLRIEEALGGEASFAGRAVFDSFL